MNTSLQSVYNKKASSLAYIDQLECVLYDHIEDIINIVEGQSTDELIDKYGGLESSLITYAYSILVMKTVDEVVEKLEQNITETE